MPLQKITKILILICTVSFMATCTSSTHFPKDFKPWSVRIYHPYLYSTSAFYVQGYNKKYDKVFPLLRPSYSFYMYSMSDIRRALGWQAYDGYGVALAISGTTSQMDLGSKILPDQVSIEWEAYDYAIYQTVLNVTDEMKTVMLQPHPEPMGWDQDCYQTTFAFGLLPDGRAKVWLYGCRIFTYVGELEPKSKKREKPRAYYGDDNGFHLRANELGAKAEPIPWEKVEKVYYSAKKYTVNTLEEALK
ncbi:hypothetical protein BS333_21090 (plasmid) [Vibrio azureus]|uniref:DUF2931 family protein n=1 Tax=Vibrio azureus NBRC 104587 TaxID=1219077 RepID=U3A5F7_9VIBR|nr:DUF2931 family protein [Vibrio azureus]AUI88872.1 hypothetical protein BS333_21090 [Vibrio azureus]GAD75236.1 hypothetical protein VAZ01S_023_00020 [Vibrio azureus NBRC 104587]